MFKKRLKLNLKLKYNFFIHVLELKELDEI